MRIWSKISTIAGKKIECNSISPIVSFTFDDAPLSSFVNGGKILEAYGFRGTFYVSAGLLQKVTEVGLIVDLSTAIEFHERGHEIGNHTYEHLNCAKAGMVDITRSIKQNRKKFAGVMSSNFAYPYGSRNDKSRVAVRFCTTSARGISFGINRNVVDFTDLKAARVYDRNGMDSCLDLASECARRGGWLIFYTHDVSHQPSNYGCTPDQLTRLVRAVNNEKIPVVTVSAGLEMLRNQAKQKKINSR